jgi:hypothetical protein
MPANDSVDDDSVALGYLDLRVREELQAAEVVVRLRCSPGRHFQFDREWQQ